MTTINKEKLEELYKQHVEYAKTSFSVSCGPDFPAVATAIADTEAIRATFLSTVIIAAMCVTADNAPPAGGGAELSEWMKRLPVYPLLARIFYLGLSYGRWEAATATLESWIAEAEK